MTRSKYHKFICGFTDASTDNLPQYHGNSLGANVGDIDAMEHTSWVLLYHSWSTMEIHNRNTSLWVQMPDAHIFMQSIATMTYRILSLLEFHKIWWVL